MASTSAFLGNYNSRTGTSTYAYGRYDLAAQRDVFVGRTQDYNVVRAYMLQYLTPAQVADNIDQGLGVPVDGFDYWCNAGH